MNTTPTVTVTAAAIITMTTTAAILSAWPQDERDRKRAPSRV